jgi:hypothetical protein
MNVKNPFLSLGNFRSQSSTQIRFWEDTWIGNSILKDDKLSKAAEQQPVDVQAISSVATISAPPSFGGNRLDNLL